MPYTRLVEHEIKAAILKEKTRKIKIENFSLADRHLTQLPREIGKLVNLKRLELSGNQLTSIPPEIGLLRKLELLELGGNHLKTLPPEIGKLVNLEKLYLNNNSISSLPREFAKLGNLMLLSLSENNLRYLPLEIMQLVDLWVLNLECNQLTTLPVEIGNLSGLSVLNLNRNQLRSLPPDIGKLTKLQELYLNHNRLATLPAEISQLVNVQELGLEHNEFKRPPPEILSQGAHAVYSYIVENAKGSQRHWRSKLIVVGEGGVGKTSLLHTLKNERFDDKEVTTRGFEISSMTLKHPKEIGVLMHLNTWDFGGQEIYHATHQFFLSDRSLFILVWNARTGWEQGKLHYWLDQIHAKAPTAPVLIVATHIDKHHHDLPLKDLRTRHENIVDTFPVSNRSGDGIGSLRNAIAKTAAELPLMGQEWPKAWLQAIESVRQSEQKFMAQAQFKRLLNSYNIFEKDITILSQVMHDLGYILFFMNNKELNDRVILKPHWLTRYIYRIIDDKQVQKNFGVLSKHRMDTLWKDLDPSLHRYFLFLMEQFDLSYRIPDDVESRSLVVELLPCDPPLTLDARWQQIETELPNKVEMHFQLTMIPPGIPTWFIARSHRFSTKIHWRSGALLEEKNTETPHNALIQSFPGKNEVHLVVQGHHPHNFFTLLKDGLELTLSRYIGLQFERLIPCPGNADERCSHRFNVQHLTKRLDKNKQSIECPSCMEETAVIKLIFGLDLQTKDQVLQRLERLEKKPSNKAEECSQGFDREVFNLRTLVQRQHLTTIRIVQNKWHSACPGVFLIREQRGYKLKEMMIVEVCCEAPGAWHPTGPIGEYQVPHPTKLLLLLWPYLKNLNRILNSTIQTIPKDLLSQEENRKFRDHLWLMDRLSHAINRRTQQKNKITNGNSGTHQELRNLSGFMKNLDPDMRFGGLVQTPTPEGHLLWLCAEHAKEFE